MQVAIAQPRSSPTLRVPWHKAAAAPESGGALRRLSIIQGDTRASCHRTTRSSPTLRVPWHKAAAAPESGGALRRLSIIQGDTRASCHRTTRSSPALRVPWHKAAAAPESGEALRRLSINQAETARLSMSYLGFVSPKCGSPQIAVQRLTVLKAVLH